MIPKKKILLVLLIMIQTLFAQSSVSLTQEEKEWIKKHPKVLVHNELNWAPFNFNEFGKAKGYSIDLINLVAKKTDLQIEFVTGPTWDQFLGMIQHKKLDIMLNIVHSEEREKYLNFTDPFIKVGHGIAYHENDNSIHSFQDLLKNKTIALEKGFYYHEYFKKNYPNIKLYLAKDGVETLQMVSSKQVDATLGILPVMNYLTEFNFINNLKFISDSKSEIFEAIELRIAARKDAPELISIIQKGLSSITSQERRQLVNDWLGKQKPNKHLTIFTKEEQQWIKDNPIVTMGGEIDWPPFDFIDNAKQYKGIIKDYLKIFEQKSGIKFNVETKPTWKELINALKNKEID